VEVTELAIAFCWVKLFSHLFLSHPLYNFIINYKIMKVKHDMGKRRILKRKSELLRGYGFRSMLFAYGVLSVYWFNQWMHPKEYQSEEEQKSKEISLQKTYLCMFRGPKKV
jgi:hypothetical protein